MPVFVATIGGVFQLSPKLMCPLEGYAGYLNRDNSELAGGRTGGAHHLDVGKSCVARLFILDS